MNENVSISNQSDYLSKMKLSYLDKIYFVEYLSPNITTIIDFGCADGSLIEILRTMYPQYTYYGIENNTDFVLQAKEKFKDSVKIYTTIKELYESEEIDCSRTHLNLSSVLHEIFAYEEFPKQFISKLIGFYEFASVSIRDMGYYRKPIMKQYDDCSKRDPISDYQEHRVLKFNCLNALKNVSIKILEKCLTDDGLRQRLTDFLIFNRTQLLEGSVIMEFLLKYFYIDNWLRECKESYFINNYDYDCLSRLMNSYDYRCTAKSFYTLPYLYNKWQEDFLFDSNDMKILKTMTTHKKLFYRKLTDSEMSIKYKGHIVNDCAFPEPTDYATISVLSLNCEDYCSDFDNNMALSSDPPAEAVPEEGILPANRIRDEWQFNPSSNRHDITHIRNDSQMDQEVRSRVDNMLNAIHHIDESRMSTNEIRRFRDTSRDDRVIGFAHG